MNKSADLEQLGGMLEIYNRASALVFAMQGMVICVTEAFKTSGLALPDGYHGHMAEIDRCLRDFFTAKARFIGDPPEGMLSEDQAAEWRDDLEPPPDPDKEAQKQLVLELRDAGLACIEKAGNLLSAMTEVMVAERVQPRPDHQTLAQDYSGAVAAFQSIARP